MAGKANGVSGQIEIHGRKIDPIQKRDIETRDVEQLFTRADFKPSSVNEENRTATFIASVGARGLRRPMFGEDYYEELEISEQAVRLERLNTGAPLLRDHAADSIDNQVGVVERGYIEGDELLVDVRFASDEDGEKVFKRVREGILRNVSIGYRVHEFSVSQKQGELDIFRAIDWEPFEVSLVTVGFDNAAKLRSADEKSKNTCKLHYENRAARPSNKPKESEMDLDKRAAELGLTRNEGETDEQLKARIGVEESRQVTEAAAAKAAQTAQAEGVETERKRASGIADAVRKSGLSAEFAQTLISEGVTTEDAHKRVIDELAKKQEANEGGEINSRHIDTGADRARLQELRSGMTDVVCQRIDVNHKPSGEAGQLFRGMTLMEMGRKMLEMGGVKTDGMSRMELAQRAMSTSDLANVFLDASNKTLLRSYNEVPRTFTVLGRRTTINDFKTVNRTRMSSFSELKAKNENGEFEHGIVKDGKEAYALATYGRQVKFSREMFINDDLDALSRMVSLFGAAAARLESKLVWDHIVGNPTMGDGTALFHADHGNLAGTGAAISTTTISAARKRMRGQTDSNGAEIDVMPAYLVCGPDKETEAEQFLSGTLRPTKTADVVPERMRNSLDLVVENRITGNQWYMFASPNLVDTFEYAFLAGQEGVYIESEPAFLSGDLNMGVRHDFAAKAIDWVGIDKNPGA